MKKNLKKVFAVGLAATMVMGTASVAMADTVTPSAKKEFTFEKTYVVSAEDGAAEATVFPNETLTFTIVGDSSNPTDAMITIKDQSNAIVENPQDIILTIPSYSTVGKYNYTVTENEGNTQGVTYTGKNVTFGVQVVASYNAAHTEIETQVVFTTSNENQTGKIDGITNIYELGNLEVEKVVTGNLGSREKTFKVDVDLTSDQPVLSTVSYKAAYNDEEYTDILANEWKFDATDNLYKKSVVVTVKHNEKVDFINLPYGVEWKVDEKDYTQGDVNGEDGYDNPSYNVNDTNIKVAQKDEQGNEVKDESGNTIMLDVENVTDSIETEMDSVIITNNKGTSVDTGISLDSMPYLMTLALSAMGALGFVSKKRKEEDEI